MAHTSKGWPLAVAAGFAFFSLFSLGLFSTICDPGTGVGWDVDATCVAIDIYLEVIDAECTWRKEKIR